MGIKNITVLNNVADVGSGALKYTAPSGDTFSPYYQVIPYERERRNKEFEFIDLEGTYVQELGMSSGVFALKLYFIGDNHHRYAEAFLAALSERGVAWLSAPQFSGKGVIPTEIKQEVDHVDAINRTIFEVRFKETIAPFIRVKTNFIIFKDDMSPPEYDPIGEQGEDPAPKVKPPTMADKLRNAINNVKASFSKKLTALGSKAGSTGMVKTLTSNMKKALAFAGEVRDAAAVVTGELDSAREYLAEKVARFNSITASIDNGAASMFESPLLLATQIQTAMMIPDFPQITNLVANYGKFIDTCKTAPMSYSAGTSDYLQVQTLFGSSALSALSAKAMSADYKTRQEASDAMRGIKGIYEDFIKYLEDQEALTAHLPLIQRFEVDSDVYESLYEMIQRLSGGIDDLLLGLRQEIIFTAEYPTTPLNLVIKHYPELASRDINAALTLFETTNQLSGDQIFIIDRGEEYRVRI